MHLLVTKRPDKESEIVDQPALVRPFLKWPGEAAAAAAAPSVCSCGFPGLHEPFVGSGAMFFDLCGAGGLAGKAARLVDTNADLILGCYRALVQDVEGVIRSLKRLTTAHAVAPAEHYYRVRDQLFNPARRERRCRRPSGRLPRETGRDVHLSESHRFQRTLPLELPGGLQRPGGAIRQSSDL